MLSLEALNVGGWLTHGDVALDTTADFLAVSEHRLIPARVRSEWADLRRRGIHSVWAPASQEGSHVGHAGVGVVSLKGAPVSMPSFATSAFREFFELGRLIRCVLPLANGRVMHLVVIYGYQGADEDAEKLGLTDQLLGAALCELAVVARGQPCVLAGDLNIEPTKIPCLLKGIMDGLWFDLQDAWASASGVEPGVTCKRDLASLGGSRRDFVLGCPLATAATCGCWVDQSRWVQPHFAVTARFRGDRWSTKVTQPCRVTPLWPAYWVSVVDKSRNSRSAEVRAIWEIYDHVLQFVPRDDAAGIDGALLDRDVDLAWDTWSVAAESALADAFREAGGPVPFGGLKGGRGRARFWTVSLGGKNMRRYRPSAVDPTDATEAHLFRSRSIAPLLTLKKKLRYVACLLSAINRDGYTLARGLELDEQWSGVMRAGPVGCLDWAALEEGPRAGLLGFQASVGEALDAITDFVKKVVVSRKESAIRDWRNWIMEDPVVHPYRWLRSDLVPPAPFLVCDASDSVGGSGILVEPHAIDAQFRRAWMPFFCRGDRGSADLDAFRGVAEELTPLLDEVRLPPLSGDMLRDVVLGKKPTAGSLDGWGWREFKALPVAWFDKLASIFTLVEEDGVWPDGLLDAYIAMIPKADGDSTPLGQRPLCVLPIAYRLWASVRLSHLEKWFRSWVPECVFSAGGGRSSVEAWYTTALDIEEALAGVLGSEVHIFVADVIKSFDTVDRGILDYILSRLGLPGWFRHAYFEYHARVRLRFKLSCGLGESWTRDGGIPQGCPLSMIFIVALYLPWCRHLEAFRGVKPQLYADNLKCVSGEADDLLEAARFTNTYIRLVGQAPAPSKCILLSTSTEVRGLMKDWVLSDAGDKWTVKLDTRDMGGHLDTTRRRRNSTLAGRVVGLLAAVLVVMALPLDFAGKLRVLRTKFLPGALHGIEGARISALLLHRLRSAFVSAVWSRKMPLAHVGAVLTLLDGPAGCDPGFFVVWCRFRLLRRYLAYRPLEVHRVFALLGLAADGCPGHGPLHLLVESAGVVGFSWDAGNNGWVRPGLPGLSMLAGPYQHFKAAIWDAWRSKVSFDMCQRQGFRGGPLLDIAGSLQLLHAPHVRERDKALLRGIMVGGVWNGFLLGHARGEIVPCRFCGEADGDGHLFWECPHPPLVQIRENPEFHDLMQRDKRNWPRCLLWHGWLPALDLLGNWAAGHDSVAANVIESRLGGYTGMDLNGWTATGVWLAGVRTGVPSANPDVWTDGSLVRDKFSGICCGGAGVFAFLSGAAWFHRSRGHLELLPPDVNLGSERSVLYFSVPGALQTVQRAELWGVIAALQASRPVHLGVDNANVVGHVGRVLAGRKPDRPLELLVDGDLVALVQKLVELRGPRTTAVSKVKGHADEGLVREGRVRELDRIGNDLADRAADLGRCRVEVALDRDRKGYSDICKNWYPVIKELHRFFIAISRAVVNDDGRGGLAPDPMVWSAGGKRKLKRPVEAVRDYAMLPGPGRLWGGDWFKWPDIHITEGDVGRWPFSTGALVKLAAFLSSLHWPSEVADLGPGGASYVELLILYERWAGERLRIEDSIPKYRRPGRPISVSAAPLCPDVDIWKLCRFFGRMLRALVGLPGGLGRFLPGRIGANHGRLRHVGWEKCCHGLTCRPRETSDEGFLSDLLGLLGYPAGSGRALLGGSLKLRYNTFPFARRKPTWRLPLGGKVSGIIGGFGGSGLVSGAREGLGSVGGVFVGKGLKRVRLTKKTPCPEIYRVSSRPIPDAGRHDPVGVGSPGPGRVVSRRVHGGSSPGSRLDREGIG